MKWGPSFCSICSHLAAPAALHHQLIYKNLGELFLATPGGVTHFQENIIVLNSVISAPFLALQKIIFQLREMYFFYGQEPLQNIQEHNNQRQQSKTAEAIHLPNLYRVNYAWID